MQESQQSAQEVLAQTAPQTLDEYIAYITDIWMNGGWVMIPLFLLTLYIYFEAASLYFYLGRTGVKKTPRSVWTRWVHNRSEATGHVGEVVTYVTGGGLDRLLISERFAAVRQNILPRVNAQITLMSVLITVAPLLGLLGTVIGMLTTFLGLASSTGQTVGLVASGIRVALITTQTGLLVAIPGYIAISACVRRRNEYESFLTQLESYLFQLTAKKEKEKAPDAA